MSAKMKKQKVDDLSDHGSAEDKKIVDKNLKNEGMIVCLDMCFYCFDVLVSHLNSQSVPVSKFTNQKL